MLCLRWSGREWLLAKPWFPSVVASDCLWRCVLRLSPAPVLGSKELGLDGCVRATPRSLDRRGCGLRVLLLGVSFESPGSRAARRELLVVPETVWLLPIFCTGVRVSGSSSSTGLGRRACAIAKGPARPGSMGTAILASTRLDSTVTGNTLSCMRSLGAGSEPPKTMLCTLLYILRQVWNAFAAG